MLNRIYNKMKQVLAVEVIILIAAIIVRLLLISY